MLSVGNALQGSGASLALDARVAVGAGVFAVGQAESAPQADPQITETAPTATQQKTPLYNSIEFFYRTDYGKIILLEQNAETGREVTQVPSEYHLRQYAASQRAQRIQLEQRLFSGSQGGTSGGGTAVGTTVKAGAAAKAGPVATTTAQPAPSAQPASAPEQTPAPSVATTAAAASTAAHVDISV